MLKWLRPLALAASLAAPALAFEDGGDAVKPSQDFIVSAPEGNPLLDFGAADLSAAYARLGLHMVLKPLPSERSLEEANRGETDAEAGRLHIDAQLYPNLIQVPEPLLTLEMQVISAPGNPLSIKDWAGLKNYRICVPLGDKVAEEHTAHLKREIGRDLPGTFRMLQAGRCDAMIIYQYHWLLIDKLGLGPFCPASGVLEKLPLFHYVNRRHEALVPRLAAVLRERNADGSTGRLSAPLDKQVEEARRRNLCKPG